MNPERRKKLRHFIKSRNEMLADERTYGERAWLWHGSSLSDYETSFRSLWSEPTDRPIVNWVELRRKQHKPVVALDLMSDGEALCTLDVDRALAVALTHSATSQTEMMDRDVIDHIAGDLLDQRTWQQVKQWVEHFGGKHHAADLIMERGIGGVTTIPVDPALLVELLQHLYSITSPDEGMLLLELPPQTFRLAKQLAQKIKSSSSIDITITQRLQQGEVKNSASGLRLIRHLNSPNQLPQLG